MPCPRPRLTKPQAGTACSMAGDTGSLAELEATLDSAPRAVDCSTSRPQWICQAQQRPLPHSYAGPSCIGKTQAWLPLKPESGAGRQPQERVLLKQQRSRTARAQRSLQIQPLAGSFALWPARTLTAGARASQEHSSRGTLGSGVQLAVAESPLNTLQGTKHEAGAPTTCSNAYSCMLDFQL